MYEGIVQELIDELGRLPGIGRMGSRPDPTVRRAAGRRQSIRAGLGLLGRSGPNARSAGCTARGCGARNGAFTGVRAARECAGGTSYGTISGTAASGANRASGIRPR